jgi:hypothetical protein
MALGVMMVVVGGKAVETCSLGAEGLSSSVVMEVVGVLGSIAALVCAPAKERWAWCMGGGVAGPPNWEAPAKIIRRSCWLLRFYCRIEERREEERMKEEREREMKKKISIYTSDLGEIVVNNKEIHASVLTWRMSLKPFVVSASL